MRLPSRLRRVAPAAAVVLVLVLLAGMTYQGVATALERRRYPRPGGLIDVGDHQLHLLCTGEGAPTVVLEAAAGGLSASWGLIQPQVAAATRVCSYDRAGLGWSEAGDAPYDPARVPEELHALLQAADIEPPYVLAGHALGAAFARLFASRHRGEVAGLVLIDPATVSAAANRRMVPLWPWLARAGLLRASGAFAHAARGLPEPDGGAVGAFLNRPDHLTRAAREVARWNDTVRMSVDAPLRVTPLIVESRATPRVLAGLGDRAVARRISAAIVAAVEQLRASDVVDRALPAKGR